MKIYISLLTLFILCSLSSKGQKSLSIKKTLIPITVDGELNEVIWKNSIKSGTFQQNYPQDGVASKTRTEVMVCFDDENIYIAAICYDDFPDKKYTIQSLKRDFSFPVSDAFGVFIDPFNDQVNGFSFAVNPLGVQREGLIQGGGSFGVSTNWDNKWFSATTRHADKWIVEMKIPLKSIRYNSDLSTWGINFARNDLKRNETSTWSPVPRQYNVATLAFTGHLKWEEKPKKAGTNVAIIPYAIGSGSKDFESKEKTFKANAGFDAKIAVTSSLNLDITVNPDFSQVEVDRQITNLSRFSLFFPEKRQFFIENSDLFSRFGFRQIRPFFSRRIGLGGGNVIPIIAGARLSGKLNKNWRIGVMNMQTEGIGATETSASINSENFTVAAVQRKVGKRSSIDAIFVNRQGFNNQEINYADYNRIVGADYNLRSVDNKWQGKAFYHHAFSPNIENNNYTHATWLMYNTEKITFHWNHEYVGENYRADVGFVPRISQYNTTTNEIVYKSYWRLEPSFNYRFYPSSKKIQNHQVGVYYSEYFDVNYNSTELKYNANYRTNFINKSNFRFRVEHNEVLLSFPVDVTFSGNTPIDSGRYSFNSIRADFNSSKIKKLNYNIGVDIGEYYTGEKLSTNATINYRVQPWGIFGISINQNKIWMPEGFEDVSLLLIGPKLEFSFTKKVFFTTFIQYNTQVENVNINARLQYRFKPMSDLYIVYTDNYYSPNFSIKNRALVIKLIYWINV